jgi:glucose-1-phosphate cytidylyltransferase
MGTKAVILCGGQGTRIREASESMPKPMLPIGGKPVVWHIMKMYAAHGITEFVLCLGYKSWAIKEFFLNYRAMTNDVQLTLGKNHAVEIIGGAPEEEWRITLAETGEDTMTGGRVAAVRRYVENDELFCLTYGDGVSDVDITRLLAFHRAHGKACTVTAVRPPGRFGEMRLEDDAVTEFNEKPQATEGLINGGFFVCDARRIWDYLPMQKSLTLEQEPMRQLTEKSELRAFRHTGFWQPMDTLREFNLLNELWAKGKAPWKTWKDGP